MRVCVRAHPETKRLSPSRPGEFHPEPLTDPCLTFSHHTARAIPESCRSPPKSAGSSCFQLAHDGSSADDSGKRRKFWASRRLPSPWDYFKVARNPSRVDARVEITSYKTTAFFILYVIWLVRRSFARLQRRPGGAARDWVTSRALQ